MGLGAKIQVEKTDRRAEQTKKKIFGVNVFIQKGFSTILLN